MFKAKKEIYFRKDIGFYIGYAIIFTGKKKVKLRDAFSDKKSARKFADRLNECSVSPLHLFDIWCDYQENGF